MSCHILIQGIKFELHAAGALSFCYPGPHIYLLFYCNSKNIAFRTVDVLAFHKSLRLKDPVLIQIVAVTEPGMAILLHVTPAMSHKFRGELSCSYFYGVLPLPPIYAGKLSHTDETMSRCARSEGLSMSRNSVDTLTDLTVV